MPDKLDVEDIKSIEVYSVMVLSLAGRGWVLRAGFNLVLAPDWSGW